jgi:hypothetical protein
MTKSSNARKEAFLSSIPTVSIETPDDKLTVKCKFNFAYMDFSQSAGQSFEEWDKNKLSQLLNKLHYYSKESLEFWTKQRIGAKNNNILEIYGSFPNKSDFKHPKHVPHQALWARFRLESSVRLVGFMLPIKYKQLKHPTTEIYFDCNTFYVVFLDANHKFYITNK